MSCAGVKFSVIWNACSGEANRLCRASTEIFFGSYCSSNYYWAILFAIYYARRALRAMPLWYTNCIGFRGNFIIETDRLKMPLLNWRIPFCLYSWIASVAMVAFSSKSTYSAVPIERFWVVSWTSAYSFLSVYSKVKACVGSTTWKPP